MKRERPIVAIDGPVAAGKSTVARALAYALGFSYINTGAMYRALALAALERGLSLQDGELEQKLAALLDSVRISFRGARILNCGRDVTDLIGQPQIEESASRLSTLAVVRERMRELQRVAAGNGGAVIEGRDIGTVVFPDAEFKFFLDAELEVRVGRRLSEFRTQGIAASHDEVRAQLVERDRRDRERELAPLKQAPDAVVIDSTALTVAEVVEAMKRRIEEKWGAVGT